MTKSKGIRRHTALEIIEALHKFGHATARTLAIELGMSHKWIQTKIREKRKFFYICDYERHKNLGRWREVYALRLNNEDDEPKPIPIKGVVRTNTYRKRKHLEKILCLTQ